MKISEFQIFKMCIIFFKSPSSNGTKFENFLLQFKFASSNGTGPLQANTTNKANIESMKLLYIYIKLRIMKISHFQITVQVFFENLMLRFVLIALLLTHDVHGQGKRAE